LRTLSGIWNWGLGIGVIVLQFSNSFE